MHFLSSHHWQPWVLAVQLAQSEKRKHCSSERSERQSPPTINQRYVTLINKTYHGRRRRLKKDKRVTLKRLEALNCSSVPIS